MLDMLQSLCLSIPTDSRVRPSDALNAHLGSIVHKCKGSSKCFDLHKVHVMSKSTYILDSIRIYLMYMDEISKHCLQTQSCLRAIRCIQLYLVPVVPSKIPRPSVTALDIMTSRPSSCIQGNRLDSDSIPQPSRTWDTRRVVVDFIARSQDTWFSNTDLFGAWTTFHLSHWRPQCQNVKMFVVGGKDFAKLL